MNSRTKVAVMSALTATASLVLAGCGGNAGGTQAQTGATGDVTHVEGAPSWCGTKKISFALLDDCSCAFMASSAIGAPRVTM